MMTSAWSGRPRRNRSGRGTPIACGMGRVTPFSSTTATRSNKGCSSSCRSMTAGGLPVRLQRLRLRNSSSRRRKLTVTSYATLVLGSDPEETGMHVVDEMGFAKPEPVRPQFLRPGILRTHDFCHFDSAACFFHRRSRRVHRTQPLAARSGRDGARAIDRRHRRRFRSLRRRAGRGRDRAGTDRRDDFSSRAGG